MGKRADNGQHAEGKKTATGTVGLSGFPLWLGVYDLFILSSSLSTSPTWHSPRRHLSPNIVFLSVFFVLFVFFTFVFFWYTAVYTSVIWHYARVFYLFNLFAKALVNNFRLKFYGCATGFEESSMRLSRF